MRILFKILMLLGIAGLAVTGSAQSVSEIPGSSGGRTAVVLVRKADYVVMPVTISSDETDLITRMGELSAARKLILEQAEKSGKIKVRSGWFSAGTIGGSSYIRSSAATFASDGQFEMELMLPLTGTNDVFQSVQRLKQFVNGLKPPGKCRLATSAATIAVDNPDKYRAELIGKITSDLQSVKQGKVSISGLENPVSVRPINYQEVELSLPYRVVLEMPLQ